MNQSITSAGTTIDVLFTRFMLADTTVKTTNESTSCFIRTKKIEVLHGSVKLQTTSNTTQGVCFSLFLLVFERSKN
jgi:hypothetical protein